MQQVRLFDQNGQPVTFLCDDDPELSGVFDIIQGAGRLIGGIFKPDPEKQATRIQNKITRRSAKGKDVSKLLAKQVRVTGAASPMVLPDGLPSTVDRTMQFPQVGIPFDPVTGMPIRNASPMPPADNKIFGLEKDTALLLGLGAVALFVMSKNN